VGVARVVSALLAVVLTAGAIAVGMWVEGPGSGPGVVAYEGTPLSEFDTSAVAVARAPFCDRLAPEAVGEALEGDPADEGAYGNGDDLPGDLGVAHEYGCWATTDDGATLRAWVFAPPVTQQRADQLVTAAGREENCTRQEDAPAYGDPSVAVVCGGPDGVTASYRGLFGDAWLSCSLSLPGRTSQDQLIERAGRWCVAVAEAAAV
jgi:hypothetical protein